MAGNSQRFFDSGYSKPKYLKSFLAYQWLAIFWIFLKTYQTYLFC